LEKADKMYLEDIRDVIKEKASKIKKKEDKDQNERNDSLKLLPSRYEFSYLHIFKFSYFCSKV
jgi:hypothetical protein